MAVVAVPTPARTITPMSAPAARGFTLIEMAAVVALIGLLSVAGLATQQLTVATAARQSRYQLLAGLDVAATRIAEAQPDRAYPADIDNPAAIPPFAGLAAADPDVTLTDLTSTTADQVSISVDASPPDPRDRTLTLAVTSGHGDCVVAVLSLRRPARYATGPIPAVTCMASSVVAADVTGTSTAPGTLP